MDSVKFETEFEVEGVKSGVFPLPAGMAHCLYLFAVRFNCQCDTMVDGKFEPPQGHMVCPGCGVSWRVTLHGEGDHDGKRKDDGRRGGSRGIG